MTAIQFTYSDGGRTAAGLSRSTGTGDCVCRAVAIATGLPYLEVHRHLTNEAQRERPGSKRRRGKRSSADKGIFKPTTRRYIESLGWVWVPTMKIGSGCRVHLRADELPSGRLIVAVSKHLTAVIDGVIHDTHDPSRGGTRCVYGYWYKPE